MTRPFSAADTESASIQFNREGGENLLAYNGPISSTPRSRKTIATTSSGVTTNTPICATNVQTLPASAQRCRATALTLSAPAGFSTALAQTRYIPKNIATGYVQAWHFGMQRKLSEGTLIDLSYVGEHGVKIWVLDDINQAPPNTESTCQFNTAPTATSPPVAYRC